MELCLLIRRGLHEMGLEQKDLAVAANVTESYISQLLTRKKMPVAPQHTDIEEKMATLLKLPSDQLARLAEPQRAEEALGLEEFLRDTSLSGDATEEEIAFLKRLKFRGKRPTALYYYRELKNLQDPLHFREA